MFVVPIGSELLPYDTYILSEYTDNFAECVGVEFHVLWAPSKNSVHQTIEKPSLEKQHNNETADTIQHSPKLSCLIVLQNMLRKMRFSTGSSFNWTIIARTALIFQPIILHKSSSSERGQCCTVDPIECVKS